MTRARKTYAQGSDINIYNDINKSVNNKTEMDNKNISEDIKIIKKDIEILNKSVQELTKAIISNEDNTKKNINNLVDAISRMVRSNIADNNSLISDIKPEIKKNPETKKSTNTSKKKGKTK